MTVLWVGSVDQLDENPGRGMILAHVVQDRGREMPCWGRDCVPPGISAGGSSFHSAAPVPLGQSGPSARGTVLIGGTEGTEVMAPISWGLVLPSSPPHPRSPDRWTPAVPAAPHPPPALVFQILPSLRASGAMLDVVDSCSMLYRLQMEGSCFLLSSHATRGRRGGLGPGRQELISPGPTLGPEKAGPA